MNEKEIKCIEVLDYICENLDEDLDSPKCREIKQHIGKCPDCSAYLISLKKTVMLYKQYPTPKLSEKTHQALMELFTRK